jgi:uncharacterized NAD-dependent epimerase/dehydratase family protein
MPDLPQPYLLFVGDTTEEGFAKTALGLRDWAGDKCVGELAIVDGAVATGLPRLSAADAVARGAKGLVIGVANRGGIIAPEWVPALVGAIEAGLDIVSGLHMKLAETPALAQAAARCGRRLVDIRTPPAGIPVATGRKRGGNRLLTVGTDCALGKKYTALAIARGFAARGVASDFRATGQTGIMIAGGGIPIDATICDFTAGAAEQLSPDAAPDHWDVIEGQGSLFHPSYAGVSLALLHGSQPDAFVVCHQPGRERMLGSTEFTVPDVAAVIDLTLALGGRTNPAIRCVGISFNTAHLDAADADALMAQEEARLGYPVADPIRGGARFERLIDACLAPADVA